MARRAGDGGPRGYVSPAPPCLPFRLTNERPSTLSVERTYHNLFHGPLFQGVRANLRSGDEGIESRVEVLPRDRLFRSVPEPDFLIDPVLFDVVMHPLAAVAPGPAGPGGSNHAAGRRRESGGLRSPDGPRHLADGPVLGHPGRCPLLPAPGRSPEGGRVGRAPPQRREVLAVLRPVRPGQLPRPEGPVFPQPSLAPGRGATLGRTPSRCAARPGPPGAAGGPEPGQHAPGDGQGDPDPVGVARIPPPRGAWRRGQAAGSSIATPPRMPSGSSGTR